MNPHGSFRAPATVREAASPEAASVAPDTPSRRRFLAAGIGALLLPALPACFGRGPTATEAPSDARIRARPGSPGEDPAVGTSPLGLEAGRDGFLFVPASYDPHTPAPLLVALHGAGGSSSDWRGVVEKAEGRGFLLLSVDSRGRTWDRVRGDFGPDVAFLDAALARTFLQCAVDPRRVALAGFSDGASYALSLGVGNGDLFTHLVAFSPGFMDSGPTLVGKPRVFVSHGTGDPVLSVAASRERIVPVLRDAGYDVTYHEFEGGHTVPAPVFDEAVDWFLG